jgi:hypothetical protein
MENVFWQTKINLLHERGEKGENENEFGVGVVNTSSKKPCKTPTRNPRKNGGIMASDKKHGFMVE